MLCLHLPCVLPYCGSFGPVPSGRLKRIKDIDNWPTLILYLSARGMSVTGEHGLYLCSGDGSCSAYETCSTWRR